MAIAESGEVSEVASLSIAGYLVSSGGEEKRDGYVGMPCRQLCVE